MFWPTQLFIRQCLADSTFYLSMFWPTWLLFVNVLAPSTFYPPMFSWLNFCLWMFWPIRLFYPSTQLFVNVTQWESRLYKRASGPKLLLWSGKKRERERERTGLIRRRGLIFPPPCCLIGPPHPLSPPRPFQGQQALWDRETAGRADAAYGLGQVQSGWG